MQVFPAASAAVCSPISDDRGDTCLSPGLHQLSTGLLQLCSGRVADVYLQRLQPVQNAAATTTSRRFLLARTGFQYASKSSTGWAVLVWRCLHDAAPRYLADQIACVIDSVCRPTPCMVASNCIPRRLGLCWSRAPRLLSMDHKHGTVCQLNSEH